MSRSDSSTLSSPPTSDDETIAKPINKQSGLNRYFKPEPRPHPPKEPSSPPLPRRPASPPHEYVLADNPDIAFIVMFRSRFGEAFPKSLPHYGPQDIESGVADKSPGEYVEKLLCALLGLVLNRKKDVERGHYGRALEEAIQTHSGHWPLAWGGKNPLHGSGSFGNMTPEQRLTLLKALILWSLSASDAVQSIIKESYKQARHEDDKNQPLSVQPWGRDGYKRNYWLIEGQDDTHFRLYRENNGATAKTNTWFSVSGSIEEVSSIADRLDEENTPHARTLRDRIRAAIPRFEIGDEKRKRKDYRLARKAAFARPEPGFSLYEGRTRGKRMKYTFSDEEDASDAPSSRQSTRRSGFSTPAEHAGPTVTASGRQVKSRLGGMYGETILVDQRKGIENGKKLTAASEPETEEDLPNTSGRSRRITRNFAVSGRRGEYSSGDGDDNACDAESTGNEWSGDDAPDEAGPDFDGDEQDEEMSSDNSELEDVPEKQKQDSLVVQLRYKRDEPQITGVLIASADHEVGHSKIKGQAVRRKDILGATETSPDPINCRPIQQTIEQAPTDSPLQNITTTQMSIDNNSDDPKKLRPQVAYHQPQTLQL